jgi:hypothetical protein
MASKTTTHLGGQIVQEAFPQEHELSNRTPEEKLQLIMERLAETVLNMSDEEVLAEVRAQGRDPLKEAEEVRKVLTDALKVAGKEEEESSPQPSTQ